MAFPHVFLLPVSTVFARNAWDHDHTHTQKGNTGIFSKSFAAKVRETNNYTLS